MQSPAHSCRDVWCGLARADGRNALQPAQHAAQAVENAPALGALSSVPLQTCACPRRQLIIEVGRHLARDPPVIPPEAHPTQHVPHPKLDPRTMREDSHTTGRLRVNARPMPEAWMSSCCGSWRGPVSCPSGPPGACADARAFDRRERGQPSRCKRRSCLRSARARAWESHTSSRRPRRACLQRAPPSTRS